MTRINRRDFLKASALTALAVPSALSASPASPFSQQRRSLNILVLGGTAYIGPHFVRHAVSRGHKVTIFTRGRRTADLPAGIERLIGDRMINDTIPQGNLRALEGRRWDVVVDDSGTDPRWVRQSAALLRDSGMYVFISSTGVFDPYVTNNLDESGPVRLEPVNSTEFAVQKAQSEKVVMDTFGSRGVVVRPTYIVGPGDTSNRFPYWPQRLARGGEVLAPGRKSDPVQIIDVRDLAEFKLKLIEENKTGVYNVAGPRETLTMEKFLNDSRAAISSSAQFVWVEDYDFLRAQRITAAIPWLLLRDNYLYSTSIRINKAVSAGLAFRPLATTVRDTLAWWNAEPETRRTGARFWITPEREAEVIAAWKARG